MKRYQCLRLNPNAPENAQEYLDLTNNLAGFHLLNYLDRYIILGEINSTNHYIVVNINCGRILPGMFHIERFEYVPDEEI